MMFASFRLAPLAVACCLATLLVPAATEQQSPWEDYDEAICLGLFRFSLFETKGRTRKRGTVQLVRTRDTPPATKLVVTLVVFSNNAKVQSVRATASLT